EAGEDSPLAREAARGFAVAAGRRMQQLQRDALPDAAVGALGEVDDAHAAFAQMPDHVVVAWQRRFDMEGGRLVERDARERWRVVVARVLGGFDQPARLRPQVVIAAAFTREHRRAFRGGQFQCAVRNGLGLPIARRRLVPDHDGPVRCMPMRHAMPDPTQCTDRSATASRPPDHIDRTALTRIAAFLRVFGPWPLPGSLQRPGMTGPFAGSTRCPARNRWRPAMQHRNDRGLGGWPAWWTLCLLLAAYFA